MLKIIRILSQINYKYLIYNTILRSDKRSIIKISKGSKIINSKIFVSEGSTLVVEENCIIKNLNMNVFGEVKIGKFNMIDKGYNSSNINISINGTFFLGNYNRIRADISVRFKGILRIGDRNNINEESEIRSDESVTIGNYNQISYKCMIWDTNTHNIYSDEKRRELTDKFYPLFGFEFEKPKTKPIKIGDDCWIGKESALLKGVELQSSSIIGYRTTLSNCLILKNKKVVSKSSIVIFDK